MSWLSAFLRPRPPARAKQPVPAEIVIATAAYQTVFIKEDNNPTGEKAQHVAVFCVRGDDRYVRVEASTYSLYANSHSALNVDKANWRYHGELPDHARRVESKGSVTPFRVVDGGAA